MLQVHNKDQKGGIACIIPVLYCVPEVKRGKVLICYSSAMPGVWLCRPLEFDWDGTAQKTSS